MRQDILLTEEEDRALLKAEYGLPLTDNEKRLLKKAIEKLKKVYSPFMVFSVWLLPFLSVAGFSLFYLLSLRQMSLCRVLVILLVIPYI